jgi:hypothetical protein
LVKAGRSGSEGEDVLRDRAQQQNLTVCSRLEAQPGAATMIVNQVLESRRARGIPILGQMIEQMW